MLAHVYLTESSDTPEGESAQNADGEAQGGLTNGCSTAKKIVRASAGSGSIAAVDHNGDRDQATAIPFGGGSAKIGVQLSEDSSPECLASGRSFRSPEEEIGGAPDGALGTYQEEVCEYLESQRLFSYDAVVGEG